MKNYIYTLVYSLFLVFSIAFVSPVVAQENQSGKIPITQRDYENTSVEMADKFRGDGKIYVVVAVLVTIFTGITVYLVMTDRKLSKLEELVGVKKS